MNTLRSLSLLSSCMWALVVGLLYYVLCFPLECICGSCFLRYACVDVTCPLHMCGGDTNRLPSYPPPFLPPSPLLCLCFFFFFRP